MAVVLAPRQLLKTCSSEGSKQCRDCSYYAYQAVLWGERRGVYLWFSTESLDRLRRHVVVSAIHRPVCWRRPVFVLAILAFCLDSREERLCFRYGAPQSYGKSLCKRVLGRFLCRTSQFPLGCRDIGVWDQKLFGA